MNRKNVEKLRGFKKEMKEIWAPKDEKKPRQEHARFSRNGVTIIRRPKRRK